MSRKRPYEEEDDDDLLPVASSYPIQETINTLFELHFPEDVLDEVLWFTRDEPNWINHGHQFVLKHARPLKEYHEIMKFQEPVPNALPPTSLFVLAGLKASREQETMSGVTGKYHEFYKDTFLSLFAYYIRGPPHSPYEHGWYKLSIIMDEEHPFVAPIVKVSNPDLLLHPQLDENGIWQMEDYSPAITMEKILLAFISTLNSGLDEFNPIDSSLHKHEKLRTRNKEIRRRAKYTWWL